MSNAKSTSSFNEADATLGKGWNYEVQVKEVERIIARLESGDLELLEVFDQFAVAVEYLRQCDRFLQERQQQVDLLIETLKDEE